MIHGYLASSLCLGWLQLLQLLHIPLVLAPTAMQDWGIFPFSSSLGLLEFWVKV